MVAVDMHMQVNQPGGYNLAGYITNLSIRSGLQIPTNSFDFAI